MQALDKASEFRNKAEEDFFYPYSRGQLLSCTSFFRRGFKHCVFFSDYYIGGQSCRSIRVEKTPHHVVADRYPTTTINIKFEPGQSELFYEEYSQNSDAPFRVDNADTDAALIYINKLLEDLER